MKTPVDKSPLIAASIAGFLILAAVAALTYWATPIPKNKPSIFPSDEGDAATAAAPQTSDPTIASLTPAGTDLILGIGAVDHLVAVSDLDEPRDGTDGLPQIGDFNNVDWEKLASVSPKILLTQFGDRTPPGFRDRAKELGIGILDVRLNVLEDVFDEAKVVGQTLGEGDKAAQAVMGLKRQLNLIEQANANYPRIRTAIAITDGGSVSIIGPGTFHDEILTIAGGENVATDAKLNKPYIPIDRELLATLAPDAILDLEPAGPSTPQQMRQAARFWASVPDLPAVRNKQVYVITEPYCLRPGWHSADLAAVFANALHGRK
jgi:iron complex transport system substrate-binding protein